MKLFYFTYFYVMSHLCILTSRADGIVVTFRNLDLRQKYLIL